MLLKNGKETRVQKGYVMVIGDNYIGLAIYKNAHVSVAIGNANNDIKSCTTHTTLTNDKNSLV
ncbi:HAD hydrolase family protein [Peribacillus simplex]|uniref:HAD hydrolase family protein n=1 Tax=Peribacillus simplex TaxID=1478 RepID=UPI003671CD9B